ncbi:hypothetical protein TCAL_10024 [Tigriopus californicus]|uniref:Uncharacterized protein n=1 Tax=Tigriopus californicus TaxID=6832 RepID=A0A553NZB0_TIGCA|nr:hypothetical protein TCAL_10024 [Tigriopus californicus]|eukprot:TCALIF_10024-PA protein Name:"Similar to TMEM132E Transmembrane protein 132E (Homo sapiens)" AED:0.04 eAED:0.04 QI:220/0.9/0.90/1/0.9/0.90/11/551/1477
MDNCNPMLLLVLLAVLGQGGPLTLVSGLDVHFDDPAAGFFLRERHHAYSPPTSIQQGAGPTTSIVLGMGGGRSSKSSHKMKTFKEVIHSERFTMIGKSEPTTIRAEYGPFQTSQTLPAQFVLPDPIEMYSISPKETKRPATSNLITDFKPHPLDLSAHFVTQEVPKDRPTLRVLFHLGHYLGLFGQKLCIHLTVVSSSQPEAKLFSQCSPSRKGGTCVAEAHLPMSWWPPDMQLLPGESRVKLPKVSARVSYAVFEAQGQRCKETGVDPTKRGDNSYEVNVIPNTLLGSVPLTPATHGYRQVGHDEVLHMLIPDVPIYPASRLVVPLYLNDFVVTSSGNQSDDGLFTEDSLTSHLESISIRLRARSGIKLVGLEPGCCADLDSPRSLYNNNDNNNDNFYYQQQHHQNQKEQQQWTTSLEMNSRGTSASLRIFPVSQGISSASTSEGEKHNKDHHHHNNGESQTSKEQSQMDDDDDVNEDVDEDELPSASNEPKRTLRPQQKPLKHPTTRNTPLFYWIFSVDGKDYDSWSKGKISWQVTYKRRANSSWSETNRSIAMDQYRIRARIDILKDDVQAVTPILKQSELMNLAVLTGRQVSRPLKVLMVSRGGQIADVTLHSSCSSKDDSVLKVTSSCTSVYVDGSEKRGAIAAAIRVKYGSTSRRRRETLQALSKIFGLKNNHTSKTQGPSQCGHRFQQTKFRVFANFVAEDSDSGRKDYFPSRSVELDVTDVLGQSALRVENPSILELRGNNLEGRKAGRTELQVISPITGDVLGTKEIRVSKNKESIVGMNVNVLTGLQLNVLSEKGGKKGIYTARTTFSKALTSQYQEGLLDIELTFSDNTVLNLKDVDPGNYYLNVKSLDQKVIAFAPTHGSRHPRVIAIGSGQGELLRVFLELADSCIQKSMVPLATTKVDVNVMLKEKKPFFGTGVRHDFGSAQAVNMGDLGDSLLSNIALRDDQNYFKPAMSSSSTARLRPTSKRSDVGNRLTPLEVGMFVLVAVFCAAMAMFVASCFVYASRYRTREYPLQRKSQSIQNAHDWVWLGKTSLGKSTTNSSSTTNQVTTRRTTNLTLGTQENRKSQRLSYVGSEINIIPNPQTDEYEAEVSNPNSPDDTPTQMLLPLKGMGSNGEEIYPELPRRSSQDHNGARKKVAREPSHPVKPILPPKKCLSGHLEAPERGGLPRRSTRNPPEYSKPNKRRPLPHQANPKAASPKVDSSTYTKKDSYPQIDDPIMPVGYPLFISTGLGAASAISCDSFAESDMDLGHSRSHPSSLLSPLELPDPTTALLSTSLRQSPASALPPLCESKDFITTSPMDTLPRQRDFGRMTPSESELSLSDADDADETVEGIPQNPDLDRPSPPRHGGGARLFENPFDLTDEESAPILPEKLSPNHVFESKIQDFDKENWSQSPTKIDSSTFVRQKSSSPVGLPFEEPLRARHSLETEEFEPRAALDFEEESVNMELDYGEMMAYFESLKESNA